VKTWLLVLLLLFAMAGVYWMTSVTLRHSAHARAYASAPACPEGKPARDCRARVNAIVASKKKEHSGRVWSFHVTLRLPDGSSAYMRLGDEAEHDALTVGETVMVERWDGSVTGRFHADRLAPLPEAPRDWPGLNAITGLYAFGAVGLAWLLIHRLRRRPAA
jgi:hypothetical protein